MAYDKDVVVIGAGFAGLYAVHKLRNEQGMDVQAFDAGSGPGGTWYWNRYPGARCDFESVHYSYSFSDDIQREWQWTERFAGQPEILAYLEFVADRLDLRRSFQFDTRVTSVVWDEAQNLWVVTTDRGATCTARYVVTAVGNISIPKTPEFTGLEDFQGQLLATNNWPQERVDLTDKRVGVIGTGASGIQLISEIADQVGHLTVFQRTPQWAVPLNNWAVEPEQRRWLAENHEQVRAGTRQSYGGAPYELPRPSALLDSAEEQRATYDKFYDHGGGFRMLVSTYGDIMTNKASNDTMAEYIRGRIRGRVKDPKTAEMLSPTDHPYGSKRPPMESDYFEAYNRDNVVLVDVGSTPIERLTARGVKTADAEYELDVVVLATGFDTFTRPLIAMNITGRDGVTLEEKWPAGPKTYAGLGIDGFPNLFTVCGPQSATALYNNAVAIEDSVDWITGAISYLRESGATTMEPTPEAVHAWDVLTTGVMNRTLLPLAQNSWWMGGNVEGKPRAAYIFAGGAPLYLQIMNQISTRGYRGYAIDGVPSPVPPLVRLDPAVSGVLTALYNPLYKPLEDRTPEEYRELSDMMQMLQLPGPDVQVQTVEQPDARVYAPATADASSRRPVVVFFHGGGFIGGDLNLVDNTCRRLAADNDAIVVSATYRLAPEHAYPAAHDDSFAAVRWVHEHIAQYGGDPDQIVVMGESAGAALAAAAAIEARDAGIHLAAQVLVNPLTDPEAATPSRTEFADGPFLSAQAVAASWGAYLQGATTADRAALLRVKDLSGLAPALILTAELDPLRDEGEEYGRALAAAGVPADVHRIDGLFHGLFTLTAIVPLVHEMNAIIDQFIARVVAPTAAVGS